VLHVIQEQSFVESDLYLSVLNAVALLFTEEVKFKVKLQGHRDLDFPFISDCLDNPGMSSVAFYQHDTWQHVIARNTSEQLYVKFPRV